LLNSILEIKLGKVILSLKF